MPQPTSDSSQQFLNFVRQQALAMRATDAHPKLLAEWKAHRQQLRRQLIRSWGGFPSTPCPLRPRVVGEIQRDGYRVEKLLLQPRPDVVLTANAYVPDGGGRRPAVLGVHGHWKLAKSEAVVQSRCIGLAKLGFFVLMVDAFGAGERGLGKALGEYHGEMVAATLWPTGLALAGLQVYENMRAVDYLRTRPEVDPERIGVTGCSGGGNQTMYVGAIDERLKCVVPVCSVGTYQSYLGAACCMCEVTPAALSYTEESGVLSLVAPRALMVINATRDAFQFSVGEAQKSIAAAGENFRLYNKPDNVRHVVVESGHGYNQQMREAMYGWMTLHLKGAGDGSPIPEPDITTEEPETLRCFPGETRPDAFVTIPRFAAAAARSLQARRPAPDHPEQWEAEEMTMQAGLSRLVGSAPQAAKLEVSLTEDKLGTSIVFSPEPGIQVSALHQPVDGKQRKLALLLDLERGRQAAATPIAQALIEVGWDLVTVDLRATGATANKRDKIGRAPDHNSAEWSMWIGRPLLGQWVADVRRLLDVLARNGQELPEKTAVIGVGPASLVALCAAALDLRVERAALVDGLASYVTDVPYENQRLGIMAPGILRDAGDIPQLGSLIAPRRLVVAGSVNGAGQALKHDELRAEFSWTQVVYKLYRSPGELRIARDSSPQAVVSELG